MNSIHKGLSPELVDLMSGLDAKGERRSVEPAVLSLGEKVRRNAAFRLMHTDNLPLSPELHQQ